MESAASNIQTISGLTATSVCWGDVSDGNSRKMTCPTAADPTKWTYTQYPTVNCTGTAGLSYTDQDLTDLCHCGENECKAAGHTWDAARAAAQSGEKTAIQRHLTGYRAAQVLITKLEQKRWVFRQYLAKIEAAGTDQEFATALAALNKITHIDPEAVSDVFDTTADLLGEQQDADRFWSQLYSRETGEAEGALGEHVPSLDELSQQLMTEAAVDIDSQSNGLDPALAERLAQGRDRVKKLLDDEA